MDSTGIRTRGGGPSRNIFSSEQLRLCKLQVHHCQGRAASVDQLSEHVHCVTSSSLTRHDAMSTNEEPQLRTQSLAKASPMEKMKYASLNIPMPGIAHSCIKLISQRMDIARLPSSTLAEPKPWISLADHSPSSSLLKLELSCLVGSEPRSPEIPRSTQTQINNRPEPWLKSACSAVDNSRRATIPSDICHRGTPRISLLAGYLHYQM